MKIVRTSQGGNNNRYNQSGFKTNTKAVEIAKQYIKTIQSNINRSLIENT